MLQSLNSVISFIIIALLFSSCKKKEEPPENFYEKMEVNVLTDSMVIYNTNIVSFMGPVKITQQAHHYQISELSKDYDESTVYHKHKAQEGYIGQDSVIIKHEKIDDTSHEIISNTFLTVVFNIDEE